jgi:hypothetical protein
MFISARLEKDVWLGIQEYIVELERLSSIKL